MVQVGLSLMLEDDYRRASEPLFANDEVEVVEWTFDMGWGRTLPDWVTNVLAEFSDAGNLFGHGVSYSPLDASSTARQDHWLFQLREEVAQRNYRHVSEHFGFAGGGNFHMSAPLPVPLTPDSVKVGQTRLENLARVAKVPVGLENLAFAFGLEDVQIQARFLDEILDPVDGFLLLDLHNIYCQVCNFEIPASKLLDSYPLERVKEIHVSGGTWSNVEVSETPVRRDTHDEAVPEEVFEILAETIPRCPNLELVFFERMGNTISEDDETTFCTDFRRIKGIAHREATG